MEGSGQESNRVARGRGLGLGEVRIEAAQQDDGVVQRQTHDAAVAADQMLDEGSRASLDPVGAGLVHRFAAGHVTADGRFVENGEADLADRERRFQTGFVGQGDRGQHPVRTPREALQDVQGVGGIGRLADHLALEFQRGVRGQHGLRAQAAARGNAHAVLGLGPRHALHIVERRFAGQRSFVDLGVGTRTAAKEKRVEGDADLGQQFAHVLRAGAGSGRSRLGVGDEFHDPAVGDMQVMIPVESTDVIGVRPIIQPAEAENILKSISSLEINMNTNWNKRYRENMMKIKSGNLLEVASVIKGLMLRDTDKGLSTGERKMLHSAKQIFISEIVLSESASYEEIEKRLDLAVS